MTMQGRMSLTIQPTSLQQYRLSSLTSDNTSTSFMNARIRGSLLPLLPLLPPLLLVQGACGGLLVVVVAAGVLGVLLLLLVLSVRSMLKTLTATCGWACESETGQHRAISAAHVNQNL
jgi:predicted membrane-bound spermidine synthase